MITIRNNLMADIATRQTGASFDALSRSVAKLSSGQRIVSAKDDAAGMAVTELLRSDVALYRQANRNAQDGISMVQTAEGAMGKIGEILTRMKGLAEQAATESYSDDQRLIMNQEFQELSDEITRIAESTTFNGISLLQESDSLNIHLGGSGTDGTVGVRSADMTAKGLELKGTETTVVLATAATLTESVLTVPAASPQMSPLAVRFQTDGDLFAIFWSGGDRNISEVANAFNIYAEADNPWTPTMYGDQENWNVEDNSYEPAEVVYNPNSGLYELQITAYTAGEGNDAYAIDDFTGSGVDMSQAEVSNGQGPVQEASVATSTLAVEAGHRVEQAILAADQHRARMGYTMNRLEASSKVLGIQAENALASQSRIQDVDVATEMAAMTRHQVIAQAGLSMLSQANAMPQMALSLLQN